MAEREPLDLTTSILTNLSIRTLYRGDILFPCIPAAIGAYVGHINKLMRHLGKGFSPEEQQQVYTLLQTTMTQGFAQSANAQIVFHYEVKGSANLQKTLDCEISLILPSLGEHYDTWYRLEDANPTPIFGQAPDAKVMDILPQLSPIEQAVVLDVGAGEGRNAIAIAKTGCRVHAVDLSPEFTRELKRLARELPIEVFEADILDSTQSFAKAAYNLVLLSEVTSHFRSPEDLRGVMMRASDCLKPQGYLLFNCFLANPGFEPDDMALEMSQIAWSTLFTWEQVEFAIADLPLNLISNESAYDYERSHLAPEHWPPTIWFEDWAKGRSTFPFLEGDPPMELRWLLFQKSA